jgi:hypothetical protein
MLQLGGDAGVVIAELTVVIKGIRTVLTDEVDEEFADVAIAEAGRLAYMSEEEITAKREEMQKMLQDLLEEKE